MTRCRPIFFLFLITVCVPVRAAEYQFAVNVPGGKGRALLWIPPDCTRVRGLIVAQQVILEKTALDDPILREAAASAGLAEVMICPGFDTTFNYDKTRGEQAASVALQKILNDLAVESGYREIATAPLLPIGHSGAGIYCWNLGYWAPQRVFGIVTLHSAPILPPTWDHKEHAWDREANVDGVPILADTGQYESWTGPDVQLEQHWRWVRGELLYFRAYNKRSLASMVVEPGATHFSWSPSLAKYVAMFIRKVAAARIAETDALPSTLPTQPSTQPAVALRSLPLESGWLTDITCMTPSTHPPSPYAQFAGDPSLAFWHVDEELARANDSFESNYRCKQDQRVTFVEDGKPIPSAWIESMKFNPIDDGMTVKVSADFLSQTPANTAGAGKPLGHSTSGPIKFRLIGGWGGGGEQVGPDKFRIRFSNFGVNPRGDNIMIMACHEGDNTYAYAEQPISIKFPFKNTAGKPQKIDFAQPADVDTSATAVSLSATSDSQLPVEYCVKAGPAEIGKDGHTLFLSKLPPRSQVPVKVIVQAYQWGRPIEPLVQTAEPVERTFLINRK